MKDLACFISQQSLGEFTLNLSSFHDKIISGELLELSGELQIKMPSIEAIQGLQTFHQRTIGKNHYPQPIMLNYLF
jgi:hypothetical protein